MTPKTDKSKNCKHCGKAGHIHKKYCHLCWKWQDEESIESLQSQIATLKAELMKYKDRRIEKCERCHGRNLNGLVVGKETLCYMCRDIIDMEALKAENAKLKTRWEKLKCYVKFLKPLNWEHDELLILERIRDFESDIISLKEENKRVKEFGWLTESEKLATIRSKVEGLPRWRFGTIKDIGCCAILDNSGIYVESCEVLKIIDGGEKDAFGGSGQKVGSTPTLRKRDKTAEGVRGSHLAVKKNRNTVQEVSSPKPSRIPWVDTSGMRSLVSADAETSKRKGVGKNV